MLRTNRRSGQHVTAVLPRSSSPRSTFADRAGGGRAAALLAALVGLALLASCTSGGSATPKTPGAGSPGAGASASPVAGGSSSPGAEATPQASSGGSLPPYNPVIDPANFTSKITNKWFPLTVGTTYVYDGTRDDTPRHTEMTVTTETKVIMGVPCLVIRDVVTSNTELVEKTVDWYAQDKAGNVWYFGEQTAEYKNGAVTSTAGTWEAGVDGALPGIVMKAAPKVGDAYRQEYRPGVAEDFAKVLKIDGTASTPAGSWTGVVVTRDTDLLDVSKDEQKSYAPGVGFVGSDGMVNGHHEKVALVSILKK